MHFGGGELRSSLRVRPGDAAAVRSPTRRAPADLVLTFSLATPDQGYWSAWTWQAPCTPQTCVRHHDLATLDTEPGARVRLNCGEVRLK